ncbi:MAG TPA: hypothetical protein PKZ49_09180 [Nitrosomonas sp.]|nr:hypothetical protein [Nitrosomonas sp.]
MAAGKLNLTIEQGSTFTRLLTIKSGGTPVNLSGYSFAGQVRRKHSDQKKLAEFTCAVGSPTSNGQVTISLTATQTSAIPFIYDDDGNLEVFYYDIEMTVGSTVDRILEGTVTLSPEVTR